MIKTISKLLGNKPKEETLSSIFKPLNGIEEKVTIRKQIIEEKILQLKDDRSLIDNQIKTYEEESKRCDQYLNSLSKFIGTF